MNEYLFQMYCRTQDLIDRAESCKNEHSENLRPIVDGWKESNELIEQCYPQVKEMLADLKLIQSKKVGMQKSFTSEQQDFICYQIGEWYLKWKHSIGDGRLGVVKEELKTMICGD